MLSFPRRIARRLGALAGSTTCLFAEPRTTRLATVNLAFAVLIVSTAAVPAAADVYGAKETTLDNGLRVVVVENSRAPVVTHMIWYRVGAMDEPPGKNGIAHVLEHLMFKGTDTVAAGEFSEVVARNGGRDNALTNQDATAYFQSVASDRLDLVMKYEADRMENLAIDSEHFEPELQVVLEERNQRVENNPNSLLREQAIATLYRHHPYRTPIIGWQHELAALTQADAEAFYNDWYAPNNAILVISGDVTFEDAVALAEKHYGPIPAKDLPDRPDWREPPMLGERTVTYRDARVRQASWSHFRLAPSLNYEDPYVGDSADAYALQVLMNIIGGGNTSYLYQKLVVDDSVAVSAGGWYDGDSRGPGTIGLYAQPARGVTVEEVEAAALAEIERIAAEGISEDDVTRAITRLQDAAATALDSLSGPAFQLGGSLVTGISLEEVEAWPDRIGAVTAADVNRLARDVFSDPAGVTAYLLPEEDARATAVEADGETEAPAASQTDTDKEPS